MENKYGPECFLINPDDVTTLLVRRINEKEVVVIESNGFPGVTPDPLEGSIVRWPRVVGE